jgi:hypothetical protein
VNPTVFKINFSTVNNLNNSFAQENFSSSFDQMSLNKSYFFEEFGAKKKSREDFNGNEEILEVKAEKIQEKKEKKSVPETKTKSKNTKDSQTKLKEGIENKKMEKADINKNKSKNKGNIIKRSSTLDENEKITEGDYLYFSKIIYNYINLEFNFQNFN